jgi:hypothetical protein
MLRCEIEECIGEARRAAEGEAVMRSSFTDPNAKQLSQLAQVGSITDRAGSSGLVTEICFSV